ncbi:MAG: hypothetical protein A2381_16645 [Bdellovibrionales bacterium RIFOXYB1_FULL_37_110]|nr:MAG: hypothetical protein A2181_07650 [Bdellovibrionales bacterium RIFOXYA1_FULL_38_20]OFZ50027.1 MAG: hypothetical protein A2417_18480 [Bdellovibrionales bacterium RIFOXYC1_FULL_37_79]OFZ59933.1 MAG: hypothetical protein A2381_16645 [Bdellovibrionales bacterium RIFOXYB1_FULL_37_110]OFZ63904.1 MAG: hypothetical protein A2577_05835 [Bdellovibrionales bacterium RIFOXYD1_FULL_36_51]
MKLCKLIIICLVLGTVLSCGKDNKADGAAAQANALSYSLSDGNGGCVAAQSFTGSTAEEAKRNYCQGLMDNQANNFCAPNERQRVFYEQKCNELNMAYDSNHFYQYNSAPYMSQYKVRYNNGNPNAWFYIKIRGNTYEEYQYELRRRLLDDQIRFEMGAHRRRQMFYTYFPGQSYFIY